MHRTREELVDARDALERAMDDGLTNDELYTILIDIIEDIDNLQFGGV